MCYIINTMKINEFDYYFKIRDDNDIVLNLNVIYKNLGYSKIDKNNISKLFNFTANDLIGDEYISDLRTKVKNYTADKYDYVLKVCQQLQTKWEGYKENYFRILNKIFDIEIDRDIKTYTYCYLQPLPINEISLQDNIIYLDYNKNIDDLFKTFIIMLTKLILINRWNDINRWNFNTEFDVKNRIWMFAEIAIDAVFANSELALISDMPTYKYFYNLEEDGRNVMNLFREKYNQLPLDDFFTSVYMFVYEKYNTLLQFKNYLY